MPVNFDFNNPPSLSSLIAAAKKRYLVRGRRGSILILVIALLVLMAIIGTAALSTNTTDRFATQQNSVNTEIDLLVEGAKNIAKATLVGDLKDRDRNGNVVFRPGVGNATTYENTDAGLNIDLTAPPPGMDPANVQLLSIQNDAWLSPRYPELVNQGPAQPVYNAAQIGLIGQFPVWGYLGAPLMNPNGVPSAGQSLYDTPGVWNPALAGGPNFDLTQPTGFNNRVTVRDNTAAAGATTPVVIPTYINYTLNGRTVSVPALQFVFGPAALKVIAADTDGDGIADAPLKKLQIGEQNGLTYYVASRIIDNGAAVNVNTAWDRDHDHYGSDAGSFVTQSGGAGTNWVTGQFFPTNIGLAQLLASYNRNATTLADMQGVAPSAGPLTELGAIDQYRFNTVGTGATLRPAGVVRDNTGLVAPGAVAVDIPPGGTGTNPTFRNDFAFTTIGEMLSTQLGRRLNYPGLNSTGTQGFVMQRFTVTDSAALAYHYVIPNPAASMSNLETKMKLGGGTFDSLTGTSGTSPANTHGFATNPYAGRKDYGTGTIGLQPTVVFDWFNDNFNWDKELVIPTGGAYLVDDDRTGGLATFTNRRAMLTADNPVSNQMPATITGLGTLAPSAFVRASVNTSGFSELQGSFLAVMSEGGRTPYENSPTALPATGMMYLYTGSRFTEPPVSTGTAPDPQTSDFAKLAANDTNPYRMFRNVIRDNDPGHAGNGTVTYNDAGGTMSANAGSTLAIQMQPPEVRKLRASIAAANTIAMRGGAVAGSFFTVGPGTTSNPIQVDVGGATLSSVNVMIYPAEKQPYITEIYVNTDIHRTGVESDPTPTTTPPAPATVNAQPYVAIELHWPYEAPTVATAGVGNAPTDLTGWVLATIDRSVTRVNANSGELPAPTVIHRFTAADNAVFQATAADQGQFGSYILLENYDDAGTGPVTYRPKSTGLPFTGALTHVATNGPFQKVYVPTLAQIVPAGTSTLELVLIKAPNQAASQTQTVQFGRPIDSFDFTGLIDDAAGLAHVWHYTRPGNRIDAASLRSAMGPWRFVYPGRYDGAKASRRHQGIQVSEWNNATAPDYTLATHHDPFADQIYQPRPSFGMAPDPATGFTTYISAECASPGTSYDEYFTTQILNVDQPGWNKLTNGVLPNDPLPNKFPYGAFARNVDILQIPFAAAYRIRMPGSTNDIEINSLSMDMSFCEDTDPRDNESALGGAPPPIIAEQLGRFCPLIVPAAGVATPNYPIDDTDPTPDTSYRYNEPNPLTNPITNLDNNAWRYRWATRVFDYLTVQDPSSDYLPNRDPIAYAGAGAGAQPVPVSNEGGTPGGDPTYAPMQANAENTVPLHGLININTAPWRVLATINWTAFATNDTANRDLVGFGVDTTGAITIANGANQVDDNIDIAKAIAWWRDGVGTGVAGPAPGAPIGPQGPFRSVYDLYRVPFLRAYYLQRNAAAEPDDPQGDFSPYNNAALITSGFLTDAVRNDFEETYILLNRISNLVTTRSDSFTVYITVQGWRGVGTANPEMVVQRRAAFIADRSSITATGGQLKVINVPTE